MNNLEIFVFQKQLSEVFRKKKDTSAKRYSEYCEILRNSYFEKLRMTGCLFDHLISNPSLSKHLPAQIHRYK